MKHLLTAVAVVLIEVSACLAQTNHGSTNADRGPSASDVQLSIALTNKVIKRGSNVALAARIRNCSTNTVAVGFGYAPVYAFHVKLVDNSGKEHDPIHYYHIRPVNANGPLRNINPSDTFEINIPIMNVNTALKPGMYSFKAKHLLFIQRNAKTDLTNRPDQIEVFSNLLQVRIE
jgi:hypothetical protein